MYSDIISSNISLILYIYKFIQSLIDKKQVIEENIIHTDMFATKRDKVIITLNTVSVKLRRGNNTFATMLCDNKIFYICIKTEYIINQAPSSRKLDQPKGIYGSCYS